MGLLDLVPAFRSIYHSLPSSKSIGAPIS